ncbi:MAG: formyl transferase [Planctomycetota bacterium]|nr:MAG: formyl transferase [Planctomycetota bacterium]
MRTVLICHDESPLDRDGLARWLASFSELAGLVILREESSRLKRRIRREIERVGYLRFLDVVAFRFYDRFFWGAADKAYEAATLARLEDEYPDVPDDVPKLYTPSPNSREAQEFLTESNCDIMIARCKTLLAERIFTIPKTATLVMHPGVCPEYRNAYGCFWALACDDLEKVGMTLLKVDKGVDTGAVYGYYSYDYDEVGESQSIIHNRVTFDNLPALAEKIEEIHAGTAETIDTSNRPSATWGQPWLTRYFKWKRAARRRRRHATSHAAVS